MDVLVVGAGIVGAACAQELAGAGLSVGILERKALGFGATAAGMGHILALDDSEAQIRLTAYSRHLWHASRLLPSPLDYGAAGLRVAQSSRFPTPDRTEFRTTGTLWVAASEDEMKAIELRSDFYRKYDVEAEVVGRDQLFELEPALAPDLVGGMKIPSDAVLYPPAATSELLDRASRSGAKYFRSEVKRVGPHSVELTNGEIIKASHVVLATGADATDLLPGLPLRKRKGHLAITDRLPRPLIRHQLIETGYLQSAHGSDHASVAFNLQPRSTGQLLIGSSRQFESSQEVELPIVERMLKRAISYVPPLRYCVVTRIWTGFRAATPDGLPLIGPYPDIPGLILATGHEGLGITTSLATAKLVLQHVIGTKAEIDPAPYLPDRPFPAT
jgi:glycine/D-amino acid oxidase-like deaminating enzyme